MVDLKLKKISWLRRRFIRSRALSNLNDWSDIYEDMKKEILTETAFQLVGHKGIVEIDSLSDQAHVLVEVVGVPKAGFPSEDQEARDVLVFDYSTTVFDVDFLTLKREAQAIISGIQRPLDPLYHIVFDGHHLALHFFI